MRWLGKSRSRLERLFRPFLDSLFSLPTNLRSILLLSNRSCLRTLPQCCHSNHQPPRWAFQVTSILLSTRALLTVRMKRSTRTFTMIPSTVRISRRWRRRVRWRCSITRMTANTLDATWKALSTMMVRNMITVRCFIKRRNTQSRSWRFVPKSQRSKTRYKSRNKKRRSRPSL